jgi:TRAP-type C4-dicarboxylate transport system permease large subunit
MTAVIIIISLLYSKGLPKYFGIVMTVMSGFILLYQQQAFDVWNEGITKNLALVLLITIVPILGIPISLGNYQQHLGGFIAKFQKRPHMLYLMVNGMFTLIAPITNVGSIYIIHSMLDKMRLPHGFIGRVYVRGITSVHTWSPYFASVFLVVYSLQIPIHHYLPYGLVLSFFQIAVASVLFKYVETRYITFDLQRGDAGQNNKKLYELIAIIVLLTGLIFVLEPFVPWSVIVLISLLVLGFTFLWSFYLQESKAFFREFNVYRKTIFPHKANEINLLLTAGLFGVVLEKTPVSNVIQGVWGSLANLSVFILIFATIIIVSLLSLIGIHQIVTVSTIVATVSYQALGIDVIVMAMMLLSAWAVSVTVSPISPVITIVTSIIRENPFKVILRWNLHYALILALVHTVVIYAIHLFWFG